MSLADLLVSNLKRSIASLELIPGKGGVFEVDVDGKRIWSKVEKGEFPDESALLKQVMALKR